MENSRIEKDSMGEMPVPADALYGASTARAIENFPIAHEPVPAAVIHAFGHLKAACAQANKDLGKLNAKLAEAISTHPTKSPTASTTPTSPSTSTRPAQAPAPT